jgi:hypothetical protein
VLSLPISMKECRGGLDSFLCPVPWVSALADYLSVACAY